MTSEQAKEDDRDVDPNKKGILVYKIRRPELNLGRNFDGTHTKLLPWVEVEKGVHIHPEKVEDYIRGRKKLGLWGVDK